jgi:hypothetical protein
MGTGHWLAATLGTRPRSNCWRHSSSGVAAVPTICGVKVAAAQARGSGLWLGTFQAVISDAWRHSVSGAAAGLEPMANVQGAAAMALGSLAGGHAGTRPRSQLLAPFRLAQLGPDGGNAEAACSPFHLAQPRWEPGLRSCRHAIPAPWRCGCRVLSHGRCEMEATVHWDPGLAATVRTRSAISKLLAIPAWCGCRVLSRRCRCEMEATHAQDLWLAATLEPGRDPQLLAPFQPARLLIPSRRQVYGSKLALISGWRPRWEPDQSRLRGGPFRPCT